MSDQQPTGTVDHSDGSIASVVSAVRADVERGLRNELAPVDFATVGPFAEPGALVDPPFAVVSWRFVGIDCRRGFNGMWPTAKQVEVRGVTIVDTSASPWVFHRHVDWNAVNSQLGGSRGRSSTPIPVRSAEDAVFYAVDHFGDAASAAPAD